jgi:ABC-type transporter Mla maintaining outer membrane lipid asymmetry ATPase subunit MlaF
MAPRGTPLIEIESLVKDFRGLRPLRLAALSVREHERVAVAGIDGPAAETLVNIVTGAVLPDAGRVRVFGEDTASITDGTAWLASLDRFGLVTPRAVLLGDSTLQQNLALPFTIEIDPVSEDVARRVAALGVRVGVMSVDLTRLARDVAAAVRVRVHLARALALNPRVLLFEHPTQDVEPAAVAPLARDVKRVLDGEGLAALIVSNDGAFCDIVAQRRYRLNPATGRLSSVGGLRRWFG